MEQAMIIIFIGKLTSIHSMLCLNEHLGSHSIYFSKWISDLQFLATRSTESNTAWKKQFISSRTIFQDIIGNAIISLTKRPKKKKKKDDIFPHLSTPQLNSHFIVIPHPLPFPHHCQSSHLLCPLSGSSIPNSCWLPPLGF